jgi:hypothetical protein
MRFTTMIGAALFCGLASTAFACDLPKLVVIPAKEEVPGKEDAIRAAANTYFTAMQAYTQCVQDALRAAGGDAAPDILKRVYVSRNNAAVAEAEFMMKLFTENVGSADPAGPPPPASPPAGRGR